jgi:hypothetical protein
MVNSMGFDGPDSYDSGLAQRVRVTRELLRNAVKGTGPQVGKGDGFSVIRVCVSVNKY